MLSHDGDGHIHEVIQDETQEMVTDIKYQMMDDGWQENIQMKRNADSGSSSTYWMTYMMV